MLDNNRHRNSIEEIDYDEEKRDNNHNNDSHLNVNNYGGYHHSNKPFHNPSHSNSSISGHSVPNSNEMEESGMSMSNTQSKYMATHYKPPLRYNLSNPMSHYSQAYSDTEYSKQTSASLRDQVGLNTQWVNEPSQVSTSMSRNVPIVNRSVWSPVLLNIANASFTKL